RIERMGLLARLQDGERYRVVSPMLLSAAEELVRLGLPLEAGLTVHEELSRHSRGVARAFVRLFVEQVWRPFEERGQPESEWPRGGGPGSRDPPRGAGSAYSCPGTSTESPRWTGTVRPRVTL